jgi:citrate lyase subunit beta/citryl-CoA lyase
MKVNRSYLYVPAEAGPKLERSTLRGADAVIADLEDAVAPLRKIEARRAAAAWLDDREPGDRVERWIRINPGEQGRADLEAVVRPGLDGICVAKVSHPSELVELDRVVTDLERAHGTTPGSTAVMPLIETARGLRHVFDIAESPRVRILQIGEIDLAADLGLTPGPDAAELTPFRARVVLASAAAGILPPVGAVCSDYRDLPALARSSRQLKAAGFVGRAAIHPAQLPTIHDTYAVSPADHAAARSLVALYEAATRAGSGAISGPDGRMVDEATVRHAHRTIWLAEATRDRDAHDTHDTHDEAETHERNTP